MSYKEAEREEEAECICNRNVQLDAAAPKASPNPASDSRIRPGWGPGTGGSRGRRCRSQGCSVRSNHGLLGGPPRSGAAGCHPVGKDRQRVRGTDGARGATSPRLQARG